MILRERLSATRVSTRPRRPRYVTPRFLISSCEPPLPYPLMPVTVEAAREEPRQSLPCAPPPTTTGCCPAPTSVGAPCLPGARHRAGPFFLAV